MSRVVFDIETFGYPIDHFDETQQEYLLKFADTPEKREQELLKLNLHAMTARIIAIGMWNPDTLAGVVLYQSTEEEQWHSDEDNIEYISGTEAGILTRFWEMIRRYDQFITFNGRAFDCPFIMIRSAILGVKPSRNLVPYRYDSKKHCDLLEQMTFYGTVRKFNLDFFCKAFGIKSPKSEGITGLDLGPLFNAGRFREIAQYCGRDIRATGDLFKKWDEFLNVND
jgi:DNA polymerase elongation subunit (family B)